MPLDTTRMNGLPGLAPSVRVSTARLVLTRNAFVAMLVVVSACAATARAVPGVVDTTAALVRGFGENKVLWVCLGIALWHLLRHRSPTVGVGHLLAAIPALLLSASAGGIWPWVGLSLSLLLLMTTGLGEARTGALLALAAALHVIGIDLLGELSGDAVLGLEARIAGLLAGGFLPGLQVEGNALQMPGGHMVVLVWGCSSLSNLGDALLLFCALVSLQLVASSSHILRGRFISCLVLLACIAIALNVLRLTLMAGDSAAYAYLHGGAGGAWFRLATLGITALLSAIRYCR